MSLPKLFFSISFLLFGSIGVLAVMKQSGVKDNFRSYIEPKNHQEEVSLRKMKEEISISSLQPLYKKHDGITDKEIRARATASSLAQFDDESHAMDAKEATKRSSPVVVDYDNSQDSIASLFVKSPKCPIVETIRYSSKVSWKPKKSAWIIDYANHYKTPLDFIYKSIQLFQSQKKGVGRKIGEIAEGTEFNVFRNDLHFQFYLVVSLGSTKMRLYYILPNEKKAVFLKSYQVGLGKKDASKQSGFLTPLGLYQLGSRIAVYEPKIMGNYKGKRIEMMQMFGTRWIPFERAVDPHVCTAPAKGFGIHGMPYYPDANGNLIEDSSSCGKFESEGCIRLLQKDVEELYSLISLRQAYIEIVPDFSASRLMKGQI